MSIICPTCGSERPETKDDFLDSFYDHYPVLKDWADKVHLSRMQSGRACHQCIEIALRQILIEKEKP